MTSEDSDHSIDADTPIPESDGAELHDDGDLHDDAELNSAIEALLLVVDTPVTTDALAAATDQPASRVAEALDLLADELTARDSGMELRESGGGWRLYTRAKFAPYVEKLLIDDSQRLQSRPGERRWLSSPIGNPSPGHESAQCAASTSTQ